MVPFCEPELPLQSTADRTSWQALLLLRPVASAKGFPRWRSTLSSDWNSWGKESFSGIAILSFQECIWNAALMFSEQPSVSFYYSQVVPHFSADLFWVLHILDFPIWFQIINPQPSPLSVLQPAPFCTIHILGCSIVDWCLLFKFCRMIPSLISTRNWLTFSPLFAWLWIHWCMHWKLYNVPGLAQIINVFSNLLLRSFSYLLNVLNWKIVEDLQFLTQSSFLVVHIIILHFNIANRASDCSYCTNMNLSKLWVHKSPTFNRSLRLRDH